MYNDDETQLINDWRNLVWKVALSFSSPLDVSEVLGAGYEGLLHANRTFDPLRGVEFKTHATIHIRWTISAFLKKNGYFIPVKDRTITPTPPAVDFAEDITIYEGQTETDTYGVIDEIKELLNVDKPSRDLLFAVIDRIEIDQYRNIEIYYKFNLIKKDVFKYKEIESPRNPYGPKGKPKKK